MLKSIMYMRTWMGRFKGFKQSLCYRIKQSIVVF